MSFCVPEKYRVRTGPMRSDKTNGNNGQFRVTSLKFKRALFCQASDGMGWEHVSVSTYDRCPTWEEMHHIKRLFWSDDDVVVQIHPPAREYVNNHPYCLHMWRKAGTNDFCQLPESVLVGLKHGQIHEVPERHA